jgi:RNA polymerase sigma-70 factor (ECF subfamily)
MVGTLKITNLLGSEMVEKNHQDFPLLAGLKRGERSIQTTCYKEYYGRMMAVVLRYTSSREDAKEIINSSFLNAFKSVHNYSGSGSFEGWLRTIVKRAAIDHCRKYVYNKAPQHEILEFDASVYNDAISQLQADDFLKLIDQVPPASRAVFNLFAIEGYGHREISETLGISEGTSKWHLSNARKKLVHIIKLENLG